MINSLYNTTNINSIRFGGLASGIDTEGMVKKLVSLDKRKVDDLYGSKQTLQWRQEAYREVIDRLNSFRSSYFNVLNRENNILSYGVSRSVTMPSQTSVDAYANSNAAPGTYVINEITALAASSVLLSEAGVKGDIRGMSDLTLTSLDLSGKSFKISLDGVVREISFDQGYASAETFLSGLTQKIDTAFGVGRIGAELIEGKYLSFSSPNSNMIVSSATGDMLEILGMDTGTSNYLNINSSLAEAFGITDDVEFKINGTEFKFSASTKIYALMNSIDSSSANVTMAYNSMTDRFTLSSKETGASSYIDIENISGDFFGNNSHVKITASEARNGRDAVFYLNDSERSNPVYRSSNSFTIDGMTYSLKNTSSEAIVLSVKVNTEGIYDKVSSFVGEYNQILVMIDEKLTEKINREYKPLTEEQKSEMTEKQIEMWEEKAKSGLLRSDNILNDLKNNLRKAFYTVIDGTQTSFYSIGITVSRDHTNYSLEIDEDKLMSSIAKNPDIVMSLFNRQGEISYRATLSTDQREQRFAESGFAMRISDIFMDNIRTTRDNANKKGILVEQAGVLGDASLYSNLISQRMNSLDTNIKRALEWLSVQEQSYWSRFSAMEAALSRMNAQSEWLAAQFGGTNG